MKWSADDYILNGKYRKFTDWKAPELIYSASDSEKDALRTLRDAFTNLPPYRRKSDRKVGMEWQAAESNALVSIEVPIPSGHIAFLENTSEKCTSPQTKHSQEGMQGAKHWVQRVDTPENVYRRLTGGYGISLMFGERCHQFIRNSNNWRGICGLMLDLDVFQDDKHPDWASPVYSLDELLSRYPLLTKICRFIMPSANSLYEGRPFKARGIVLFDTPVTDQRVYRAFGDTLLSEIDCIPQNVTKTAIAVGFGNTHNAKDAWYNNEIDTEWITEKLRNAKQSVLTKNAERQQQRQKSQAKQRQYQSSHKGNSPTGANISAFIEKCDPVAEMIRDGLLTNTGGTQYHWHESDHDRSCDILDGTIHIFSNTMTQASPAQATEPVGTHRFYLYILSGLDMTVESDRPKIREFLFEKGYGSDPKAYNKRTPKLQNASSSPPRAVSEPVRTHDADATSEKYESTDESDRRREQAADTFFTSDTDKSLHILIVKEGTGKGKTHTFLGKSKEHGKRTLMNPPHNELAAQAVETARIQGYENPFHLLGREHNWDESGIADIPPDERTADLFDRNNCINVDQIKAYTDKRLAPRTYCEHQCRFRDGCLHMAQYEDLSDRDFIASCTPGLLFDLNMRGYLESLVTTTDEVSDTELAMDAVLGTESKEMPEFDFAILDDYSVSSLYTDVVFSQSEFKTLKKAWIGTPTGEFAKKVLKAFEKKKPRKIVEALRKAFESTSEHHAEIAKSLTQHARIGTIEYAEQSKLSAESKRLLSEKVVKYTDGGQQFIPVDFDAYKELKEKGIPCVHPKHLSTTSVGEQVTVGHSPVAAIRANVKVKDLTPVWQSTATPITMLRIFLDSIGDERHAPISRTFRNSESPVAILTFSVPPQAPVGLIPQMAMICPTSPPDDTKRPFTGQPVTFSEHTSDKSQWADGVAVYQFQDARLTSASVFEYPVDDDGKRILPSDPISLTATAERRISKLNEWAKEVDGLTAFISYKEFTDTFSSDLDNFDTVTHFDKVAGLNFDGLKYLVVFGYPKVKHDVVMTHARKQFVSDHERLPKGTYDELTEIDEYTDDGITITERRYIDPRLEKIRLQLSVEKIEQAIGRARHPRWTDTTTMIFTNSPVSATSRASLFTDAAFTIATSPSDLPAAAERITDAEQSGDVQAIMETTGVSERTAQRRSQPSKKDAKAERDAEIIQRFKDGNSKKQIATDLDIGQATVKRVLDTHGIGVTENAIPFKYILKGNGENGDPPKNIDDTYVPDENASNGHHPVPRSEYSKLNEQQAIAELQHCEHKSDYAGASLLRSIIKKRGWKRA